MFEVKVKTLDGRNTNFTVEDEITVAEFKEKISEKVNIPADRQRLIFTGKVLVDGNKLKSYNVADKVIHVVNRTPPSASSASGGPSSATTTTTSARPADGGGNRPSLSMSSVPSNMLGEMMNSVMSGLPGDATVHHIDLRRTNAGPSNHTESGRRVVLARQWIRDAHSLLDRVRDPIRGTRLTADTQTPEARNASQIVPHMPGESISVSVSTSGGPLPQPPLAAPQASTPGATEVRPTPAQRTAVPAPTPVPTPTQTATSAAQPAPRVPPTAAGQQQLFTAPTSTPPVNPHVEVLNSLWGEVHALHDRLHPLMHRYQDLLRSPVTGCPGHNQHLFDTISSVTHSLGHIYHALSDLNCDFGPESSGELTASPAPAPPPTAIIQQTIPVTIPLRATVNVSPRTSRRNRVSAAQTSTTSTTNTSSSRPSSGPPSQSTPTSAATPTNPDPNATDTGQVFTTSIEVEMETDSGEDISEDGQPPPAAGQPTAPQGPFGGFNISQLLQDAFMGMAGGAMPAANPPAAPAAFSTPATTTTTSTPTPAARGNAPTLQSGAFGQFIPPAGAATATNGMFLPPGMHLPANLPPGFPFPPGTQPTPKDRQDPYLSSCSSKHWVAHSSPRHEHTHPPSGPRTNPRSTPTSNTASRGVTANQSNSRRNPAANQRQTMGTGGSARTASASSSASSATSISSRASGAQPEVLKRKFYEEISAAMVGFVEEHGRLGSTTQQASPDPLSRRVQEICRNASLNRQPPVTITELHRITQDSLPPRTSQGPPPLGLLDELCILLFKDLTVTDLFQAYMGLGQGFDRLRGPLRRFARSIVLQDGPHTNENLGAAVDRLMVSIREQLQTSFSQMATQIGRCPFDVESSMCSFIRDWLLDMLNFIMTSKEGTEKYGQKLLDRLHQGFRKLLRLGYELFSNSSETVPASATSGSQLATDIIIDIIEYCTQSRRVLGQAFSVFASRRLRADSLVSSVANISLHEVRDHLIMPPSVTGALSGAGALPPGGPLTAMQMDTLSSASSDYQDAELNASLVTNIPSSSSALSSPTVSPSPLTTSTLSEASAADWRTVIPADWVAIIEEDIKRQLRLESVDQPLSDAYLNGRPQKRRRFSDAEDDHE